MSHSHVHIIILNLHTDWVSVLMLPWSPPPAQPAAAHSSTQYHSSTTCSSSTQNTAHSSAECRPVWKNQELGELVEHANAPRTRQFQDLASFEFWQPVCLSVYHHLTIPRKLAKENWSPEPRRRCKSALISFSYFQKSPTGAFNRTNVFRKSLTFMHSSKLEGDRNEYWWCTFWVDLGRPPLPLETFRNLFFSQISSSQAFCVLNWLGYQ